ncbi:MAG: hypothetical protein A3F16_04980 [Deltaproteobacteria bacterium RIFCSPHIGHO2_12_FULL_43_9]|nr:MAG: hypothetical protein A3F16_04980 [Deltaproteobacteria bacterium RIFCSPHIGHO2_12_FULL_43_9]
MLVDLIIPIAIIFLCLCVEAFFSGSEMAIVSADKVRMRHRAQQGDLRARTYLKAIERPERILITTLIGTNIMVITVAAVSTFFLLKFIPDKYSELVSLLILTPVILILGEIVPKGVCQQKANSIAASVVTPLYWVGQILGPIIWLVEGYINILGKIFNIPSRKAKLVPTKEELKLLLETTGPKSDLKAIEKILIGRIFELTRTTVRELMLPLIDVDAISENSPISRAVDIVNRTGHSRIPVYRERIDNIVGILFSYDLLGCANLEETVSLHMKPALYAPENQPVDDLLLVMKKEGQRMAIVVDEYGGAEGVIAFEDIIEEVVGTIEDEYDYIPKLFRELEKDVYLLHAKMDIYEAGELLNWTPPKGDYATLSGFLLTKFGHIPKEGEFCSTEGWRFTIVRASKRVIELVKAERIKKENGKDDEGISQF